METINTLRTQDLLLDIIETERYPVAGELPYVT
jgi:hypothetical protein